MRLDSDSSPRGEEMTWSSLVMVASYDNRITANIAHNQIVDKVNVNALIAC
jgi:hypothetical protein